MEFGFCPADKVVTAREAVSHIKNGSRIFIGSACGEPRHLIDALVAETDLQDAMIYQMLAISLARYLHDETFIRRFSLKLFFVAHTMRDAFFEGKIDYIPTYLSEIPYFFRTNQIGLDVALVQISPPDRFGYGSLGVSVDVTREAARRAKLVIAQVNPRMPRTLGEGFIHVDEIDYFVPFEEPLVEYAPTIGDQEVARRIAYYVSELVDDGATLQIGYGHLPNMILSLLGDKNDLGIHTNVITDAFVPLCKSGVITNRNKNFLKDRAVASFCQGTSSTYEFIDNNPSFFFGTADFVNNASIIAQNDNLISISSALEVDLTGQVCSDSVGRRFFSGTGDQANFIRGASLSKGGFSIVALPSTAKDGTVSRIVANLSEGAGLATLRADVNFVVTEYGVAQLKGKSIYQRAIELTQIAHPSFRESLVRSAKQSRYISMDQLPPPATDLMFTEEYKSRLELPNGRSVSVRPLLPSDEIAYRNFFYSLKQETIYYRFFSRMELFTHGMAQSHWANLDYRKNVTLIGLVRNQGANEVMAIATYADAGDQRAEIAIVVREDFQGMGVAKHLVRGLQAIAIKNGYRGLTADVLAENKPMLHVFQKLYPHATRTDLPGEVRLVMDFEEQSEAGKAE
ncbi:MAG: GNAT family N-acetyltransferase [Deltaproteobacteria bacterium]|nr:GNAT family N-acetyltransferase [Deltaproteobacteria bacterium]